MKNKLLLGFTLILCHFLNAQNRSVFIAPGGKVNTLIQGNQTNIKKVYVTNYYSSNSSAKKNEEENNKLAKNALKFFSTVDTTPQYKILILPLFAICDYDKCQPDFGSIIYKRLLDISVNEELNFELYYLKGYKLSPTFNSDSALNLKKYCNANLIIYGTYNYLCLTDTTVISLNWISDSVQQFTNPYPYSPLPQANTDLDLTKTTVNDFLDGKAEGSIYSLVYYIAGVHSYSGNIKYTKRKYDSFSKSIELLNKGLEHCENSSDSMLCLAARAHIYSSYNSSIEGVGDFNYLIQKNPNQLSYRNDRGMLAFRNNLYKIAIQDFFKVNEFRDSVIKQHHANYYPESIFYIVLSYLSLDSPDKALRFWDKVVNDPREQQFYNTGKENMLAYFAKYFHTRGQLDSAIVYAGRLIEQKKQIARISKLEEPILDSEFWLKSYLEYLNHQYKESLEDLENVHQENLYKLLNVLATDKSYQKAKILSLLGSRDSAIIYTKKSLWSYDTSSLSQYRKDVVVRERYLSLVFLYEQNKNFDSAIVYLSYLQNASMTEDHKYYLINKIAINQFKKGDFSSAAQLFDSVYSHNHSIESQFNVLLSLYNVNGRNRKDLIYKIEIIRDSLLGRQWVDSNDMKNIEFIKTNLLAKPQKRCLAPLNDGYTSLCIGAHYEMVGKPFYEIMEHFTSGDIPSTFLIPPKDIKSYPFSRLFPSAPIKFIF